MENPLFTAWIAPLILGCCPALILLLLLKIFFNRFRTGAGSPLFSIFLCGCLTIPFGILFESVFLVACYRGQALYMMPLLEKILFFLLVVGPVEEGLKIIVITLFLRWKGALTETLDGIAGGVAVGLGFAAIENLLYLSDAPHLLHTALLRNCLALPLHCLCGAISGYYVARGALCSSENPFLLFWGFSRSIQFHAWYDVFAVQDLSYSGCPLVLALAGVEVYHLYHRGLAENGGRFRPLTPTSAPLPIVCPRCQHGSTEMEPFCPVCGENLAGAIISCPECAKNTPIYLEKCCHCHQPLAPEIIAGK